VIGAFPGARITKTRPAVVLSTPEYHYHRPDVILGLVTTKSPNVLSPTDCEIREWRSAGLHAPSCFRLYVITLLQRDVRTIGRLSDDDWKSVQRRLAAGLAIG
jgi:mRNA interferase MazF